MRSLKPSRLYALHHSIRCKPLSICGRPSMLASNVYHGLGAWHSVRIGCRILNEGKASLFVHLLVFLVCFFIPSPKLDELSIIWGGRSVCFKPAMYWLYGEKASSRPMLHASPSVRNRQAGPGQVNPVLTPILPSDGFCRRPRYGDVRE